MTPTFYARFNYLDWYAGDFERDIGRLEEAADAVLADQYRTLHTFYRTGDFTADDFARDVKAIQDQTDLIILDHLHYVDSDDENENRGLKEITKRVRDVSIAVGKPVVAVAHVRKGDRRSQQLIPTIEDFHGSSDITKIATKAIMLAPAYDQPNPEPHLWSTYIAPQKCRPDGGRARFTALVSFDARRNGYSDSYSIGRIVKNGEKFETVPPAELPAWARQDQ